MSGLLPPTRAVLRAYRLSTYRAGGVVVRIGCRPHAPTSQWIGRGPLVLLSACNPGGRRLPDGWNRRMMARLAEAMRGIAHVEGEGRLGRWSEPLVLASISLPRGIVLARRFRQNAVVYVRGDRPARLVLLAAVGVGTIPVVPGSGA